MRLLALALLGLLGIAFYRGWLATPGARRAAAALAAIGLLAALPWGADPTRVRLANLPIALAVLGVLAGRRLGVAWLRDARRELTALAVLAVAALLVYLNLFSFHRAGAWVHQHDVAHYYLGSKYFAELGYGRLYVAAVRAEAETHGNHFSSLAARDLASGSVVHIGELLRQSDAVKSAFTPARWQQFKLDLDTFHERNAAQWGIFLTDHGFNPTPVWAALGGALANRVPAGSERSILLLTLLDPLLLLALAALAARAFGARAALLAGILFCLVYGATFDWVGGAFLRQLWFAAAGAALCLLRLERPAAAGAALALAAALRIFPALLVWGLAARAVAGLWRGRESARPAVRFLAAFAVVSLALVAWTGVGPRGLASWNEFAVNLGAQAASPAANDLGLPPLLRAVAPSSGAAGVPVLHLLLFALAAAVAARSAIRVPPAAALLAGAPLVFVALGLSAYYWILLVLLALAAAEVESSIAPLFALEASSWACDLAAPGAPAVFLVRSLLLGLLLAAWLWALHRRALEARPVPLA
jgi:hypothetical protein